jgi:lipid A 4'-phosphatase
VTAPETAPLPAQARLAPYPPAFAGMDRFACITFLAILLPALTIGLFPQVDLAVAGWFYTPGHGFFTTPLLDAVHHWAPNSLIAAAILAAVILAAKRAMSWKGALFVALCFLIGPGLFVNGALKEYYGRARPVQVEQFGGAAHFTSALVPAHECAHNCSFTAGDPACGFTLITFALLFPRRRKALTALALAAGGGFGLLRIAQGGHFLSDVLFTGAVCVGTTMLLFEAMFRNPARG